MRLDGLLVGKSLLYVLVVLGGAALLCVDLLRAPTVQFSGELRVVEGERERWVVRPAPDGLGVYGSELPIEDTTASRDWIDPQSVYDALPLPMYLHLSKIEILKQDEASYRLTVTQAGQQESHDLSIGETLNIGPDTLHVSAIDTWSGLLRDNNGPPMAAIALCPENGAWTAPQFVASGAWLLLDPEIAIRFEWAESEQSTRAAAQRGLPGLDTARWGVRDSEVMQWFDSFLPGVGCVLADGRSVTLREVQPEIAPSTTSTASITPSSILVGIAKGNEWSERRVVANQRSSDDLVRFEFPSALKNVWLLHAWEEDKALVTAYSAGVACGTTELSAGQTWTPDGMDCALRLHQAMDAAVVALAKNSTMREVVLEGNGREWRIRQGQAIRYGNSTLRLDASAPPPSVRYYLDTFDPNGTRGPSFQLDYGDVFRYKEWSATQGNFDPREPETAVLQVDYLKRRIPVGAMATDLTIAACGGIGLLISLRRVRRAKA